MPRSVLVTTLSLVAVAAALGLWLGLKRQPLNETHVIERIAKLYVEETGGQARDCVAVPGVGPVWVSVTCGARVYDVDHRGQVLMPAGPST